MSKTTLVQARWIVTGAGPDDPVLDDAGLLVEDGKIVARGTWQDLRARHPNATIVGGPRMAAIPGLINAHHHANGPTQQQQGLMDDFLEPWIFGFACFRGRDVALGTLLSCARQLRSGVTSVVDVHSGAGKAKDYAGRVDAALHSYAQSGMRVGFAPGLSTRCHLVHGDDKADENFLASLPSALAARLRVAYLPGPGAMNEDDWFAIVEAAIGKHRAHPTVDVWFGPPGPQWVGDRCLQRVAERAEALDTNIQTHLVESYYEKLLGPRLWNKTTLLHLNELGVLGPRLSFAHGTWLTEEEIGLLAKTGGAVSHNPSSNLRLRAGIAPLNAFLKAGATTGIGLDGTTLNDDDDMFTEMRLALRLARGAVLGEPAPTPRDVLGMATLGGAKLMGKEGKLGRLAPGYEADIVLLDLERILAPWTAPEVDPLDLIVLRAGAQDVRTVLVAGKPVYADGRALGFDEAAVTKEIAAELSALPYPADAVQLARELLPHVEAFYRGWDHPAREPFTIYNARR
jgi:5-methylthioadenosine/S-adenosylhomocysteine deaminase